MPQLDSSFYFSQIFWLLVCLTVLILFFARVLVPRMENIFRIRQNNREREEALLGKLQSQKSEAIKIYEENIEAAEKDAFIRLEQSIRESQFRKKNHIQNFHIELESSFFLFRAEIQDQENAALASVKSQIKDFVSLGEKKFL